MNNRTKNVEISGQKLWCGSLGLIQHFINNPNEVKDTMIVELGAGTGVLGMMCKKLGSVSVVLTDHDERSLTHMKDDIQSNEISADVIPLDWYVPDVDSINSLLNEDKPLRIVAGDVLYKNALLDPFFNTVKALFALREDSLLFLCHVPRAGVDQSDVVAKAESSGLCVEEIPKETWNTGELFEYCPEEDLVRARIYRISKQSV
jgi:predicted nicotinamide N-methyase